MKSRHILAALLALSMVALASIATVAATDYSLVMIITRHGKNYTWHIDTTSDGTNGPFSGFLVDTNTIVAECWDSQGIYYTVTPHEIVLAENYVELHFKNQDLPKSAIGSSVAGSLTNGADIFFASGPGWAWSNVR